MSTLEDQWRVATLRMPKATRLPEAAHFAEDRSRLVMTIGDLEINFLTRIVKMKGRVISLTKMPYKTLELLALAEGKILTHATLLGQLYPHKKGLHPDRMNELVYKIRKGLGADGRDYIVNVIGLGFKLVAPS